MKIKYMLGNNELVSPTINILSSGTDVKGEMNIDGDFRIDGTLKGNIKCSGKLTIGLTGSIDGQIVCQNAEISGTVNGSINAAELIILKDTSNFNGDILTAKLIVESGAKLTVVCKTE